MNRAPEHVRGGLNLATLPNALSLLRVVLLVPILWLLDRPDSGTDTQAAVLLFVAGMSDLMDGFLARRRGSISPSGKVVDPLADKILIGGVILYLALERGFPLWLVAAILLRDVVLVAGALLLFRRDRVVFSANWSGKLTTFGMGLLVLSYVLRWQALHLPLTIFSALALAASYLSYGWRAFSYTRDVPEQPI